MNTLNDYIAEYLEYCEYRKRLDTKGFRSQGSNFRLGGVAP